MICGAKSHGATDMPLPLVPTAAISRKILRHATNDINRAANDVKPSVLLQYWMR